MPTKTKSKKTAKVKKSVIKKTSLLSRFTLKNCLALLVIAIIALLLLVLL
jgi:hypothetical protein